ncbi:MAG TPA: hypothetical protein VKT53_05695 [Candidatus Acidoferrum sp.]|nr:hypothetical protein [Candidatus Acidoferrum sp.]
MPNQERYRELLENIREAHAEHKKIWEEKKRRTKNSAKAYEAADAANRVLILRLRELYETTLTPRRAAFLKGNPQAIDEIISFLGVDVPAFRTGYDKEWFYGKLKKLSLSEEQIAALRGIALARCASNEYRREDSELRRLMIGLADMEFLEKIAAIPSKKASRVEGHKRRMLQVVLAGRKDLREAVKNTGNATVS